jgi:1,4-alpha-glucan branching enzyme
MPQTRIAVIVDVVYNHLGPSDIASYWDFDGNVQGSIGGNGTWFYTDWRGKTPWGDTEPNWGSGFVRLRLVEAARLFIEDYHCDGLRVDSTVTIRKDAADGYDWNGSDDPNGWSWLQYLNNTIRGYKGGRVVTIAEDIASNTWITKNTGEGGAGLCFAMVPAQPPCQRSHEIMGRRPRHERSCPRHRHTWDVGGQYHQLVKYHSSHDMVDKRNGHYRLPNRIGNSLRLGYKSPLKTGPRAL